MSEPDPRLNAYRGDLADIRLEGRVKAGRYVAGEAARVAVAVAPLRRRPDRAAGVESELLFGDTVAVFERAGGWAWVQAEFDGYVGYTEARFLSGPGAPETHVVCVPRTFVYPEADLKSPQRMALSLGSRLAISGYRETRGTRYGELVSGGFIVAVHVAPAEMAGTDYVAVAESLIGTPYLWGGTSAFGLDCSGLVQLSMRMCGRKVPRDSDMQQAAIGELLSPTASMRRGDLIFWKGHVAVFCDESTLVHASGHAMQVVREPAGEAIGRIAAAYGDPLLRRRP